jgi:cytochrome c oxidase assembly factor CtaG
MDHWHWKPDPFAAFTLALSASLYIVGMWRMRARGARIPRLESGASLAGWLILAIALLSPMATMAEWLFSVHMTQHELLMLVAAPLLAIGRPVVPMMFALPPRWRIGTRAAPALRMASSPLVATAIHFIALWIWHLPALYDAAVVDDRIHLVQHVCFTGTAALFWWGLIRGRYGRLGYGAALIYVFATALHSGGLGALLAFSNAPWYSIYVARSTSLGDALTDQQLGGIIMWVPSGIVMMLFGLALFAAWLGEAERRRERGYSR